MTMNMLKWPKMGFKHIYFVSYNFRRRRGVTTLIWNAVNYEHIAEYEDKEGRFVTITGKIEGMMMTRVTVL